MSVGMSSPKIVTKPGISLVRNRSPTTESVAVMLYRSRIQPNSLSDFGIAGSLKNESRMMITKPTNRNAWTTPRIPPMISSTNVFFWNSACL